MSQIAFKIGDCVVLKHGGAKIKMTIDFIAMQQGVEVARCKWYNSQGHKFETEVFALDALDLCTAS